MAIYDQDDTYSQEIKRLMEGLEIRPTPYEERPAPAKVRARIRRLTPSQRRRVEELSRERGYRRLVADWRSL